MILRGTKNASRLPGVLHADKFAFLVIKTNPFGVALHRASHIMRYEYLPLSQPLQLIEMLGLQEESADR